VKNERENRSGEQGGRTPGGWGIPGMGGPTGGPGMGRHGGRGQPQKDLPDGKRILEQIWNETGGQMLEGRRS